MCTGQEGLPWGCSCTTCFGSEYRAAAGNCCHIGACSEPHLSQERWLEGSRALKLGLVSCLFWRMSCSGESCGMSLSWLWDWSWPVLLF